MSCTASPGISRGSVKTMAVAISSEGTATRRRRTRYRRSTAPAPVASAFEPGGHQPAAVVVAEARRVVLQRALPDADVHARGHLHVVLLLGQMALDVEDDLAPLGEVDRPSLADEQVGHHGIVDVALVLELFPVILAEEEVIGLEEPRLRPVRHRVELAVEARRDVGAVLFRVELDVDPDVLEVLLDE